MLCAFQGKAVPPAAISDQVPIGPQPSLVEVLTPYQPSLVALVLRYLLKYVAQKSFEYWKAVPLPLLPVHKGLCSKYIQCYNQSLVICIHFCRPRYLRRHVQVLLKDM